MGRSISVLGVILLLLGGCGLVFSFLAPVLNLGGMFNPATTAIESAFEGPQAAELCNEGEEIITERGESEVGPSIEFRRTERVFCVDAEGNRREVTAEYAGDVIGGVLQTLPGFFGSLGLGLCASFLLTAGVILFAIGWLISRQRKTQEFSFDE